MRYDIVPQDTCKHPVDAREDFGLGETCLLCMKVLKLKWVRADCRWEDLTDEERAAYEPVA